MSKTIQLRVLGINSDIQNVHYIQKTGSLTNKFPNSLPGMKKFGNFSLHFFNKNFFRIVSMGDLVVDYTE